MRRLRLSVAATIAASLVLAGCAADSGSDDPTAGGSPATSAPAEPETWPLTGLEVGSGRTPDSPAYIVKIDNTGASAPQVGLGRADLVVEELVEGGITRLAAFFQTRLPNQVGPVRSMRLSDIGIAKPLGAEIVTSGAARPTLDGLAAAGQKYVSFDSGNPALARVGDGRHAPYNVMANLKRLGAADTSKTRPVDYLPFGDAADFPGTLPAKHVDAQMSRSRTSRWTYGTDKYFLENGYMPDGDQFLADTLIVCMVRTSTAGYLDPAGNPVPISHFEGRGKATIFHGGKAVEATWIKPKVGDTVTFRTKDGALTVPTGRTWLHLVPNGTGSVSYR